MRAWLFGGWAEELLGLTGLRPHHDVDLLYPAENFDRVDSLLAADARLSEITAKRLAHKRAFLRQGIMTELILVRCCPWPTYITEFWGRFRYEWPPDLLAAAEVAGLRVASRAAVERYRVDHALIHAGRRLRVRTCCRRLSDPLDNIDGKSLGSGYLGEPMPFPPVGLPPPNEPGLPEGHFWELEEPTEADLLGLCPDLLAGPPDGEDAWLGELSLAELDALADQYAAGLGRRPGHDGVGAGFGRDLPGDLAFGFSAGGRLMALIPGRCWPRSRQRRSTRALPSCPMMS